MKTFMIGNTTIHMEELTEEQKRKLSDNFARTLGVIHNCECKVIRPGDKDSHKQDTI